MKVNKESHDSFLLINICTKSEIIINNSIIILKPKVKEDFKSSFNELQLLIEHETCALIPAGIYDSYEELIDMINYLHNFELKIEESKNNKKKLHISVKL